MTAIGDRVYLYGGQVCQLCMQECRSALTWNHEASLNVT